jgi:hypothetical protein
VRSNGISPSVSLIERGRRREEEEEDTTPMA